MLEKFITGWTEDTPLEVTKNLAYWERNMLALLLGKVMNQLHQTQGENDPNYVGVCGWYYDTDNNWDGWKRVVSLDDGRIGFHVPDEFDVGDLPLIEANWDGHTTKDKWLYVMNKVGAKIPDTLI
ncbi:hypothetical protein SP15_122 [Bacillus phage SP-15]|uniref:Uncharacterized protein n=1 Tax=Bacillus phage SP-15 TaxID=1792032 RepID=A0A127AWA6_9CAUD|nr:hypothetical protein SP15_122 [Bacillus phage SP-15]AMM44920.1 hypothetical protein SP15_122 [Bacillus phage SP-15]